MVVSLLRTSAKFSLLQPGTTGFETRCNLRRNFRRDNGNITNYVLVYIRDVSMNTRCHRSVAHPQLRARAEFHHPEHTDAQGDNE